VSKPSDKPEPRPAACVAPVDGEECGERATAWRIVEGIACPLCAKHAREYDAGDTEVHDDEQ
jgi:hypothetical protein